MPQPPAPTRHNRPLDWKRHVVTVLMLAVLGALAAFALYFRSDAQSHRQSASASNRAAAAYESLSKRLAATNDANCKQAGRKCVGDSKQVVKSLPTSVQSAVRPVGTAATGVPGKNGLPGRGIFSTEIAAGHLVITYTDGQRVNVGPVVGHTGKTGAQGKPGRGIESTSVAGGDLLVSYTDGTSKNLGTVVGHNGLNGTNGADGQAGRGVESTTIVSGHLIVAYTDNTADDVGQVVGKDGVNGLNGASISNAEVNSDGDLIITISTPQSDGTTTTKTIDAGHVVGRDGTNGTDGKDGRGISDTEVTDESDGSCHLIVTYSDGTTHDAGAVGCPTSTTTPTPTDSPSLPVGPTQSTGSSTP